MFGIVKRPEIGRASYCRLGLKKPMRNGEGARLSFFLERNGIKANRHFALVTCFVA
jgi:hypothetical protein